MTIAPPVPRPHRERVAAQLFRRELEHYPGNGVRYRNLALVVLATVSLYFMVYVVPAIAVSMMKDLHMSFAFLAGSSLLASLVGAFAAMAAGISDRWGRANIVAFGLLIVGLLTTFGVPYAANKEIFLVLVVLSGFIEGLVLVASPAIVRDFSPQLGRATAMGMWNTGPVLGSLVVAVVASLTLDTSSWQDMVRYAGIAGIVVALIAIAGLRDLAAAVRNQVIVSARDRELIDARSEQVPAELERPGLRTVLRADVVLPALGVGFSLLFYLTMVGNSVIFFVVVHDWPEQRANSLNNWTYAVQALALIAVGVLSDRLRVRKPFILFGTLTSIVVMGLFATIATDKDTTYGTFVVLLVVLGVSGSVAYAPWLAGYTENIERHGPAATVVGLAIWGWTTRLITVFAAVAIAVVVSGITPLVEHHQEVTDAQNRAAPALAVIGAHPGLFEELGRYPADRIPPELAARAMTEVGPRDLATVTTASADLETLTRFGPDVRDAEAELPGQWKSWFWVCVIGQLVFLPTLFLIRGRWNPRRAREDFDRHERAVSAELGQLEQVREDQMS
ncbi:MFS transporter [Nocardia sp. NPDC056100]|uniref:MFS transporter n=1 Tax=Nocardia sp. NPDC056100 TaxID=3345712 RepID=UPI0035E03038